MLQELLKLPFCSAHGCRKMQFKLAKVTKPCGNGQRPDLIGLWHLQSKKCIMLDSTFILSLTGERLESSLTSKEGKEHIDLEFALPTYLYHNGTVEIRVTLSNQVAFMRGLSMWDE
jgi:hypothetical protein